MSHVESQQPNPSADPNKTALTTEVTAQPLVRRRRRQKSPLRRFSKRVNKVISWRALAALVISVVAIYGVVTAVLVTRALSGVTSSLEDVSRILNSFEQNPGDFTISDFERLRSGVTDLRASLNDARQQTTPVQFLSGVIPEFGATLDALRASQQVVQAANLMLTGIEPTMFFLLSGGEGAAQQISSGERVVELLRIGSSQFTEAQERLLQAENILGRIQISALSDRTLPVNAQIVEYREQLEVLNELLLNAPDLLTIALGLNDDRAYLVLSANSDELRPSGGYVSTYGWMRVSGGRVVDYAYSPTADNSPNPPPANAERQIEIPDWWLPFNTPVRSAWDGSWSVDFAETAERAAWYYNTGRNRQAPVDGVISIDLVGFEYILGALGSVEMPEYNTVITPSNFRRVVYDIRAFGRGEDPHKQFVAAVYQAIFARWQTGSLDQQTSAALIAATLRSLREKHMMFYFSEPNLNEVMDLLGWSGRQNTGTGYDYLMLADTNLGNKSSRSVVRQITYDVRLMSDRAVESRASINYNFPASIAENDPAVDPEYHGQLDYFTLMQFFIPEAAQVQPGTTAVANLEQVPHSPHTLLTGFVSLPFNTQQRVQFSYRIPDLIEPLDDGVLRYRLLIQKQPGSIGDAVTVQVSLPPDARFLSANPEPVAEYRLDTRVLEFAVTTATDQWVEVTYALAP
ncbi:MAG: DUF4012 domain-containing protein [bacterium]|nr:DUF4012 domain-containing protein [bacterium]